MNCPNCGTTLVEGSRFCADCGLPIVAGGSDAGPSGLPALDTHVEHVQREFEGGTGRVSYRIDGTTLQVVTLLD
jgi:hypothetical protein